MFVAVEPNGEGYCENLMGLYDIGNRNEQINRRIF